MSEVFIVLITFVLVLFLWIVLANKSSTPKVDYRSLISGLTPIGSPVRNKQKKIVVEIVRDANVNKKTASKCAQNIMNVLKTKVTPFIPVQFEYGLPEEVVYSNSTLSDKYDYGIIIFIICQNITDFTSTHADDNLEALTQSINAKDLGTLNLYEGSLHSVILIGQNAFKPGPYGNIGDYTTLHEIGHALGLRHEMVNPKSNANLISAVTDAEKNIEDPGMKIGSFDINSIMFYPYPKEAFENGEFPKGYDLKRFSNKNANYTKKDLAAIKNVLDTLDSKAGEFKMNENFDPENIKMLTLAPIAVPCSKSSGLVFKSCDSIADKSKWTEYTNVKQGVCKFTYYKYPDQCDEFKTKPPAVELK